MKNFYYITYIVFISCNLSNTEKPSSKSFDTQVINGVEWMVSNLMLKDSVNNTKDYFNYMEALNACPQGWHLPNINEWNNLLQTLNNSPDELSEIFQTHNGIKMTDTTYLFNAKVAYFWAESDMPHIYYYKGVGDTLMRFSSFDEDYSISVRCVKN